MLDIVDDLAFNLPVNGFEGTIIGLVQNADVNNTNGFTAHQFVLFGNVWCQEAAGENAVVHLVVAEIFKLTGVGQAR